MRLKSGHVEKAENPMNSKEDTCTILGKIKY